MGANVTSTESMFKQLCMYYRNTGLKRKAHYFCSVRNKWAFH